MQGRLAGEPLACEEERGALDFRVLLEEHSHGLLLASLRGEVQGGEAELILHRQERAPLRRRRQLQQRPHHALLAPLRGQVQRRPPVVLVLRGQQDASVVRSGHEHLHGGLVAVLRGEVQRGEAREVDGGIQGAWAGCQLQQGPDYRGVPAPGREVQRGVALLRLVDRRDQRQPLPREFEQRPHDGLVASMRGAVQGQEAVAVQGRIEHRTIWGQLEDRLRNPLVAVARREVQRRMTLAQRVDGGQQRLPVGHHREEGLHGLAVADARHVPQDAPQALHELPKPRGRQAAALARERAKEAAAPHGALAARALAHDPRRQGVSAVYPLPELFCCEVLLHGPVAELQSLGRDLEEHEAAGVTEADEGVHGLARAETDQVFGGDDVGAVALHLVRELAARRIEAKSLPPLELSRLPALRCLQALQAELEHRLVDVAARGLPAAGTRRGAGGEGVEQGDCEQRRARELCVLRVEEELLDSLRVCWSQVAQPPVAQVQQVGL
mmetsp:Transcript_88451/g.222641  ORF Transcript_88451/g.222641 Transcript_88451/m.222641 type:complete len:497 (-) Transcript_88451:1504-2994(-)